MLDYFQLLIQAREPNENTMTILRFPKMANSLSRMRMTKTMRRLVTSVRRREVSSYC